MKSPEDAASAAPAVRGGESSTVCTSVGPGKGRGHGHLQSALQTRKGCMDTCRPSRSDSKPPKKKLNEGGKNESKCLSYRGQTWLRACTQHPRTMDAFTNRIGVLGVMLTLDLSRTRPSNRGWTHPKAVRMDVAAFCRRHATMHVTTIHGAKVG